MLAAATNTFAKWLGVGGSGSVFAGALFCGTPVAVKVLDSVGGTAPLGPGRDLPVAKVLKDIQHPNIVPLLGWSTDGVSACLVYALMESGSLQDRLACKG